MTRKPTSIAGIYWITTLAIGAWFGLFPQNTESAASWTKGHRKVLVIPVRFTNANGPSDVVDPNGVSGWGRFTNGTTTAENSSFFIQQSYNQFSVEFTILPEIDLGVSTHYYSNTLAGTSFTKWTAWGSPGSLADDARAKARAVGLTNGMAALFESDNYDLDIIACGYNTYMGGAASDGGRGVIAFNFNALPHELCHCLGLQHANGTSRASGYAPVKNGSYFYDVYGDIYCLMGYKMNTRTASPPPNRDINPYFKYQLGWLTDANIATPSGTSGTYRIHAFDQGSVDAGKYYALRIARDPSYTYWFSFRQAITNLPDSKWSQSGLEVRFGGESIRATSGTAMLWDMTPGSRGYITTNYIGNGPVFATMHDAPLQIGRTYTDAEAYLHVTPIKKGGTTPESLDVVVNFGAFTNNLPPTLAIFPASLTLAAGVSQTFTATASDPEGDTLAYYWEFDDNTTSGGTDFGGLNADSTVATNGAHIWTQNGANFVRCTVSDMKGHTRKVSATVMVTNGIAAPMAISGVVSDELGNPLDGAIVNNFKQLGLYGGTNFAGSSETAADGKFQIAIPKPNSSYTFSVMYKGYSFTCSNYPGGTLWVNSNISDLNFKRVILTHTISCWVAGAPVADSNIWVSDGSHNVPIVNWGGMLSVTDGSLVSLTATATNPAYSISSDFPTPYRVVDDVFAGFFVSYPGGEMPRAAFPTSGTNSDDTVGNTTIPVVMTLPTGMTNWGANQWFSYTIDPSSSAEYGVDYKTHGGQIIFYGGMAPSPFLIPLTVFHDSIPKHKTVVFKLAPASSVVNLGAIDTFTYTLHNAPYKPSLAGMSLSNGMVSFSITNLTDYATNYVLRCHDLMAPSWTTSQIFTGVSGQMQWTEAFTHGWDKAFYRVICE